MFYVCGFFFLYKIFFEPIVSLKLGSSDTFSSLPKNPRIVLNAGSRTDFSGSTVNEQSAGKTRFATSLNRKYCWVAANASIPATRAGGNGSRIARMNADTKTLCRTYKILLLIQFIRYTMKDLLVDANVVQFSLNKLLCLFVFRLDHLLLVNGQNGVTLQHLDYYNLILALNV